MQGITRVLVKVKTEEDSLPPWFCTFGAEPKFCTGYKDTTSGTVYIPLDSLVQQGFSFPLADEDPDFYDEEKSVLTKVEDKLCLWFFTNEVEVLVN